MAIVAEYIWIDGSEPTRQLRSKTKVLPADFTVESEGGLISRRAFLSGASTVHLPTKLTATLQTAS